MSGAITAVAILAASQVYQAEETRKVQSAADDRFRDEKLAFIAQDNYGKKKKEIADKQASTMGSRLRENTPGGNPAMAATSGTAVAPTSPTGVLGGSPMSASMKPSNDTVLGV